jgi:hypothetical protein
MEDLRGHGAEQQPGESAEAVGTDDQQVSILSRLQEDGGRISLDNVAGDRHALAVHSLQDLVLEAACGLTETSGSWIRPSIATVTGGNSHAVTTLTCP